jgi:hypothetical protein
MNGNWLISWSSALTTTVDGERIEKPLRKNVSDPLAAIV